MLFHFLNGSYFREEESCLIVYYQYLTTVVAEKEKSLVFSPLSFIFLALRAAVMTTEPQKGLRDIPVPLPLFFWTTTLSNSL